MCVAEAKDLVRIFDRNKISKKREGGSRGKKWRSKSNLAEEIYHINVTITIEMTNGAKDLSGITFSFSTLDYKKGAKFS